MQVYRRLSEDVKAVGFNDLNVEWTPVQQAAINQLTQDTTLEVARELVLLTMCPQRLLLEEGWLRRGEVVEVLLPTVWDWGQERDGETFAVVKRATGSTGTLRLGQTEPV